MNKICKGDEVLVIAGKDKSKRGVVRALVGSSKVLVEGVNLVKKHVKPNPMKVMSVAL
jgi:ribosomal protein L24, bacterial/organelle